jgi:hypothetical protein
LLTNTNECAGCPVQGKARRHGVEIANILFSGSDVIMLF